MDSAEEAFAKRLDAQFDKAIPELRLNERVVFQTTPLATYQLELFVGREDQIDELVAGLNACFKGVYKKIIIHGDRGIGKTSLMNVIIGASRFSVRAKYAPLTIFDSTIYMKGFDECFRQLVFSALSYLAYVIKETRADSEKAIALKGSAIDLAHGINTNRFTSNQQIIKSSIDRHILIVENEDDVDKKIIGEKDLIEQIAKHITEFDTTPLLVCFDEFHTLLTNEKILVRQQLLNLVNNIGWTSILVLHTDEFNQLKTSQNEITKDAFVVQLPSLTSQGCKELLRRRLLASRNKEEEIEKPQNYSQELLPFNESAVDILSKATDCNPLNFVKLLKKAYLYAEKVGAPVITQNIALDLIKANTSVPLILSPREQRVLDYIKEKGEVRIQDIADFRGTSRISAYFILKTLYEAGILTKKRRKREVFYKIKPLEI